MAIQKDRQDLAQRQAHRLGRRAHSRDVARGPLRLVGVRGHPLLRAAQPGRRFSAPSEHMQRLLDSAKIYRIDVDFTRDEHRQGHGRRGRRTRRVALLHAPGRAARIRRGGRESLQFARPRSTSQLSVGQIPRLRCRPGRAMSASLRGRALRPTPCRPWPKPGANYMNSQLIKMEAIVNGYAEGIALDTNGYVSEGSGENIFMVRNGTLHTAPLGNSVLPGITRDSVLADRARPEHSDCRTDHPARDALHRRRSVLHAAPPRKSRRSARSTRSAWARA